MRRTRSLLHAIPAPTRERSEASRRWKASSVTTPGTRWITRAGVPERKADGRRWTLNLGACIECESPCEYGMERLRRLKIHELLELGCGADCLTCPEPCRVYKLAVGKIAAEEIQKAVKRKQAEAFARAALAQYLPEGAKREQPLKGRAHRRSPQRAAGVEWAEKKEETP